MSSGKRECPCPMWCPSRHAATLMQLNARLGDKGGWAGLGRPRGRAGPGATGFVNEAALERSHTRWLARGLWPLSRGAEVDRACMAAKPEWFALWTFTGQLCRRLDWGMGWGQPQDPSSPPPQQGSERQLWYLSICAEHQNSGCAHSKRVQIRHWSS